MSTQCTASWCLFHALCSYCAWRGTLKSITSRSLWLLSIGSTGRKNSVCCSNFDLQVLTPNWWQNANWKHIQHGKCTGRSCSELSHLFCDEGSIRLRPECPWGARKSTIVPKAPVQYRNLLLSPPPAKHTFHLLSDQWRECGNWLWRFSLVLQKWTAPSSSRCTCCERRRRYVTFFDTSWSEKEYFPGSMSIQILYPIGIVLVEEPAGFLLCGFAFAFDRHAKSFASSFNAKSPGWSSGISVSLLFKSIKNLFDPWEILTQEWVL